MCPFQLVFNQVKQTACIIRDSRRFFSPIKIVSHWVIIIFTKWSIISIRYKILGRSLNVELRLLFISIFDSVLDLFHFDPVLSAHCSYPRKFIRLFQFIRRENGILACFYCGSGDVHCLRQCNRRWVFEYSIVLAMLLKTLDLLLQFPEDICLLPHTAGLFHCKARIPRFSFIPSSGKCEGIIYGGCHATPNNFPTLEACEKVCGNHKRSWFSFRMKLRKIKGKSSFPTWKSGLI